MPPPRGRRLRRPACRVIAAVIVTVSAATAWSATPVTATAAGGSLFARLGVISEARYSPPRAGHASFPRVGDAGEEGPAAEVSLAPADPIGASVAAIVDPPLPDGYRGWRTKPTRVTLVPTAPGRVMYAWDRQFGAWEQVEGPLAVPEGPHVLYAYAEDAEGRAGEMLELPLKVDTRARAVTAEGLAVLAASLGVGPQDVVSDSGTSSAGGTVRVVVQVVPPGGGGDDPGDPGGGGAQVVRLAGPDRYGTAVAISTYSFPTASAVVVATGADFADALSASGLAGSLGGPIILTTPNSLPAQVESDIRRLAPTRIIIVGGQRAVSAGVESSLKGIVANVTRIGGVNRYDTAAKIAAEVIKREGAGARARVYIARGDVFADALSLSPYAYRGKSPVLLTMSRSIPAQTRAAMSGKFGTMIVGGGTAAVSTSVESQLRSYVSSSVRVAGSDRFETAVKAADYGVGAGLGGWSVVSIATGRKFPDALCGGAATGARGGVMLLCPGTSLVDPVRAALKANVPSIREVVVLGGPAAVDPAVQNEIVSLVGH